MTSKGNKKHGLIFNYCYICERLYFNYDKYSICLRYNMELKKNKIRFLNLTAFLIFIFFSVLLSYLNNYKHQDTISTLGIPVFYLSLFIFAKLFIKIKINRVLYICLFIVSMDSLLSSSFVMVFDIFALGKFNEKLISGLISLLFNFSCIFIMYLCRKQRIFKNFRKTIKLIPKSIYLSLLFTIFLMGGLTAAQTIKTDDIALKLTFSQFFTALIIPTLILLIIIMLINSVSRRFYENISSLLESQVKRQIKYYEQLEEKNNDLRAFKHDYENHIQCLKYTLKSESKEEALEYIEGLNLSFEETQNKFNTGNFITDALFNEKNSICEKLGITFKHMGAIPMTYIKSVDLCILFFNLLDNAIEACEKIINSEKVIKTISDYKHNHLNIVVSNTVCEPVKIQNNYIISTKNDKSNHGFGLMNIHKIVKKYNGNINMVCDNGWFSTEITFYAPIKDKQ